MRISDWSSDVCSSDLTIAKRAADGRDLLDRIAGIDVDTLPHDLPYTVEIARQIAERWTREEEWYWLLFDPLGVGFYAMFAPTAYCGGFLLNSLPPSFSGYRFASPGAGARYGGLVRISGRGRTSVVEGKGVYV